ncbi:MAG: PilZ domain-containing protein [Candidatus Aureabacteria bacterium]|nr:PilZ domain-containing protein [Candidatus Auribacterota bacterium]
MPVKNERRKYVRIETNLMVTFKVKGDEKTYPSLIINMSQGGLLLKSFKSFPLDIELIINIAPSECTDKEIVIPAKVNRCDTIYENKLYHLAVDINRKTEKVSKVIDNFYKLVLKKKKQDSSDRLKK